MAIETIPVRVGGLQLEVEVVTVAGTEATSSLSKVAHGAVNAFDNARQAIIEIAASVGEIIEQTSLLTACPNQLEVTFGLKVSAQATVIVAGLATEATLQVKLVYDVAKLGTSSSDADPRPPGT